MWCGKKLYEDAKRAPLVCDACKEELAKGDRGFRASWLLGNGDLLCYFCFEGWYDGGCGSRQECAEYSQKKRTKLAVKCAKELTKNVLPETKSSN